MQPLSSADAKIWHRLSKLTRPKLLPSAQDGTNQRKSLEAAMRGFYSSLVQTYDLVQLNSTQQKTRWLCELWNAHNTVFSSK